MEGNGPEINPRIEELLNAWRTELNAPEILPYNDELVDYIKDMLTNIEVTILISLDTDNIPSRTLFALRICTGDEISFSCVVEIRRESIV